MDLAPAFEFAGTTPRSVLTTIRRNTRPQLSNVSHAVAGEAVHISITADRAKYHNLVREPWAALHITDDSFGRWVVLEGPAELSAVAAAPDDDAVQALVDYYRAAAGEHPDWDEYRAAMVRDRRVLLTIRPDHAYGQLP